MARLIQIVVPSHTTTPLLKTLQQSGRMLSIRLQPGVSLEPPGDLVTIQVKNRELMPTLRLLDEQGVGRGPGTVLSTAQPLCIISPTAAAELQNDTSECSFEEIETALVRDTSSDVLLVMAISGFIAVSGLATGALHIVVAGMLIAPGFEPLVRIARGVVARSAAWRAGLRCTALAYAALFIGAAIAALVLRFHGKPLLSGSGGYLPTPPLVAYWTNLTLFSVLEVIVAATAGAFLVATNRSILTAGVMIALGLIPAAALVPAALVESQWDLAGRALLRWAVDAALVVVVSFVVFGWKQLRVHRRQPAY